jgi:hypothetical protein
VTLDNDLDWRLCKFWVFASDVSLCVVEPIERSLISVLAVLATWKWAGEALVSSSCSVRAYMPVQVSRAGC